MSELTDDKLRGFILHAEEVGNNGTPAISTGELAELATQLLCHRSAALRSDQKEAAEEVKVKATAQELVDAERRRHIDLPAEHGDGQMLHAAVLYRSYARGELLQYRADGAPVGWPWEAARWKPTKDVLSNLVRAGALCVAERDRLEQAFTGRATLDYSPGAPASFKLALILGDINLLLSAIHPIPDRGEVEALRAAEAVIDAKVKEIDGRYEGAGHRAQEKMGYAIERLSEVRDAIRALSSGDTRS